MPRRRSNVTKANLSIFAVIVMSVVTLASVFVYRGLIARTFNLDTGGTRYSRRRKRAQSPTPRSSGSAIPSPSSFRSQR